jgi:hypothetical protein
LSIAMQQEPAVPCRAVGFSYSAGELRRTKTLGMVARRHKPAGK